LSKINKIPVIDLFAGPGGLGEGFSSLHDNNKRIFDIKLSIEKDINAYNTLLLRSFYRKFKTNGVPDEYYNVLRESDLKKREILKNKMYKKYPEEFAEANKEALNAELGSDKFPNKMFDNKIKQSLENGKKNWVLIGGPPCQAYSLVGRSRVGGINSEDHRVYLYKEYLRIIARHQPSVFVMENVKGLLSAKVNGDSVFPKILSDLQNPKSVFPEYKSLRYKIYSLVKKPDEITLELNPIFKNQKDFLIKSEEYGVPQKRHRVILLGIREDINKAPGILSKTSKKNTLKDVIEDLPQIRSGISRSIAGTELINGKEKRIYKHEDNTDRSWQQFISGSFKEFTKWSEFVINNFGFPDFKFKNSLGAEFIKYNTEVKSNPLHEWFTDKKLQGISNHISRSHLKEDLNRYLFSAMYTHINKTFPKVNEYIEHSKALVPDHKNVQSGKFADRFRVQKPDEPATTITSHISKDGHYFIHYDYKQCRSLTVREAARVQTFPDNYLFCGNRTAQYHQVGNAVPPYLAFKISEIVYEILK